MEKPIPRGAAQSSMAVTRAPDWVTKASLPGAGAMWLKLALSPIPGTMRPRQLGPAMRKRCGRAPSSKACWRVAPWFSPASRKPAVMITAARVPRAPSSATRPGTLSGGVAITAKSGVIGSWATLP